MTQRARLFLSAGTGGIVGAALVLAGCLIVTKPIETQAAASAQAALPAAGQQAEQSTRAAGEPLPSLAPMLEDTLPGVVNIATKGKVKVESPLQQSPFFNDPFFRRFFGIPEGGGEPRYRQTQSLGSGVIVDAEEGYILTNTHVVKKADQITVTLKDKREFTAEVIGSDPETDIAVIQIDADDLTEVPFGDSEGLRVGDFVVAIGNPFGLQHTVTSGIVSAKGRSGIGSPDSYQNYIQTDASINPGNSGGALVDLNGRLVGINTAILSQSGGNIGIGFAIPSNLAEQIMQQLIKYGEVERGRLGVVVQNLTPELAKAFGLDRENGVVIVRVQEGTSADKAGLEPEDVIVSINGKKVEDYRDLRNAIGLMQVGDEITLEIIRDGEKRTVETEVGEAPEQEQTAQAEETEPEGLHPNLEGAVFTNVSPEHPLHGTVQGAMVKRVARGSPAMRAGLRPGDVITSVNREPVRNVQEFKQAVTGGGQLLLRVRRGQGALFILIEG